MRKRQDEFNRIIWTKYSWDVRSLGCISLGTMKYASYITAPSKYFEFTLKIPVEIVPGYFSASCQLVSSGVIPHQQGN
jgi:hypothetical protein